MIDRKERIKQKGFNFRLDADVQNQDTFQRQNPVDYAKIKVGAKTLDDAVIKVGDLRIADGRYADKRKILHAIAKEDILYLRQVSNFFYKTSGIYQRILRYMAYLYRYDWMVTPYLISESVASQKIIDEFNKILMFLDAFGIKNFLGRVALRVFKDGAYYGYIVEQGNTIAIQDLDANYCRSRFKINNRPCVEFNMRFFDDHFKNVAERIKVLNLFPDDFKKGYLLYKKGKLQPEFPGDTSGWYVLDVKQSIRFAMDDKEMPPFISMIPSIIDLDEAQDLNRKRLKQKLLRIIIQQLPLDKNGDPIFDIDEAIDLHNNAVRMVGKSTHTDVLTTFASTTVADMSDKGNTSAVDDLEIMERTVYNSAGIPQNLFNADGNISLEKSVINDEAYLRVLMNQFEVFLNQIIERFNTKPKKIVYKVHLLPTTEYNYIELSKLYKEHTQLGYSKMLPQIALGQAQSAILANAHFENEVLELVNLFIPPMSSNTMNAESMKNAQENNKKNKSGNGQAEQQQKKAEANTEENKGGRKELPDSKKSDKTIANRESMS